MLANRLTADGTKRVLVLEAGSDEYAHPHVRIPAGIMKIFKSLTYGLSNLSDFNLTKIAHLTILIEVEVSASPQRDHVRNAYSHPIQ